MKMITAFRSIMSESAHVILIPTGLALENELHILLNMHVIQLHHIVPKIKYLNAKSILIHVNCT